MDSSATAAGERNDSEEVQEIGEGFVSHAGKDQTSWVASS